MAMVNSTSCPESPPSTGAAPSGATNRFTALIAPWFPGVAVGPRLFSADVVDFQRHI
jgi:hypothetical protein